MPNGTCLITGGTGNLGNAVTKAFLDAGHEVAATWLFDNEKESLEAELGGGSLALVKADVTDEESIAAAVAEAAGPDGYVDRLVHLVGGWSGGQLVHEQSLDTWNKMIALNLTSAFLCAKAVLPGMRERGWGRMVFVSARTAILDREGQSAYAISKAGVSVLAQTIAEENRDSNVTANVVAPSTLDTPANRTSMPGANHEAWVSPQDLAQTILFLTSEQAGSLRGAWLPVFGGV